MVKIMSIEKVKLSLLTVVEISKNFQYDPLRIYIINYYVTFLSIREKKTRTHERL